VLLYTFYATREALRSAYQNTSIECFCDALIREKYNLVQLGVIKITGTSKKYLVAQHQDKSKNSKKKHPRHNNKKNKGPKPLSKLLLQNTKVRRLKNIANFVENMVTWSLNVLKIWKH
jgi:hypothetical protein